MSIDQPTEVPARGGHAAERPLVSILAPAFNEAGIVHANLARIAEQMERLAAQYRWELIVVDDGSTDGTGDAAAAYAAQRDHVHVCRHRVNLGLGRALRTGFQRCSGRTIVVVDLDLTYAPDTIPALLARIAETEAAIVLASPYMRGGRATKVPWLRRVMSRWGNRFLALTARGINHAGNISTLTGMVRAYDAGFIRSLSLTSTGMEINTEIIYKALLLNARVEEVPAHLDWSERRPNLSLRDSGRRIQRGILFSLLAGFTIRPFAFFIIPAGLLAIVSLYMLSWIGIHVADFYREIGPIVGGTFDDRFSEAVARSFRESPHAFMVVGVTLVLTVQLFSLGLMALQAKQYFEELFTFGTQINARAQDLEQRMAAQSRGGGAAGDDA